MLPTLTKSLLLSPFTSHVLLELPASLQFFLFPSRQLSRPTPHAHAIIRQYAILLFSSVLVAACFALRGEGYLTKSKDLKEGDELERYVAFALGLYHVGPVVRSGARVWGRGKQKWRGREWEAAVYVVLHVVVGGRSLLFGRI